MRRGWMSLSIGLACLVGPAGSQFAVVAEAPSEQSRLERHKSLVRRWIDEGFNQRTVKVVDETFAEAVVVNGRRMVREDLRRSMTRFLTGFPDLHVTITDIIAEGEKVGIWYTAEGTHRGEFEGIGPTGKAVRWTGADLLRIDEDRIVEAQFLSDSLGLLRQLGGAPPAP